MGIETAIIGAAVIGAGAAVAGSAAASDAASEAADKQSKASDKASDAQIEAAKIAAEAQEKASQTAAEAATRAAELAAAGQVEAARIAAEESRRAQELAIEYQRMAREAAIGFLDESLGQASESIVRGQTEAINILEQFGDRTAELYKPYIGIGPEALSQIQAMAETGVQVPTDLTTSPYYPLYQFQQQQQQKNIDQQLAARGLYDSGSGLAQQLAADTGLTQQFTAQEYQRAVDDYNRRATLYGNLLNTGFTGTGNYANILNATGANIADTYKWGQGTLANLQANTGQAKANAALGTGQNLSNIAMSSGAQLANIQTNLGNQLGNIYTNEGSQLSNIATNQGNNLANIALTQGTNLSNSYMNSAAQQAAIINQAAQNRQNLYSNLANTAMAGANAYAGYTGWQNYLNNASLFPGRSGSFF